MGKIYIQTFNCGTYLFESLSTLIFFKIKTIAV
jgi:hypothetical protein